MIPKVDKIMMKSLHSINKDSGKYKIKSNSITQTLGITQLQRDKIKVKNIKHQAHQKRSP